MNGATGVWALVPAKDFERAKSRLRGALGDEASAEFARGLFRHVLATLSESQAVEGVLVATDSDAVAEEARRAGASVHRDAVGAATLAEVVDAGLDDLAARGARAALVLMADLPELRPHDLVAFVALGREHEMVIARAADGRHTNALLLAPPGAFPTAFGHTDSFRDHIASARARGLRVAVVENARISFDVDGPDDHARLVR
jgi:2-phospho-L-lactate/phosphoenolpyruvate guanylyltransferase